MDYQDIHERYADDIKITALSQRVPGLDYDDVVSEMTVCLWKAADTWDPDKGAFGSYWWSLWLNRRSDLTEAANRLKRPKHVLMHEVRGMKGYVHHRWPDPPRNSGPVGAKVWNMLASGEQVKDVIEQLGLSRRGYYDLISSWRTAEVRGLLGP